MLEVKANVLEESFDAILQADRIAGLEERIEALDDAMKVLAERAGRPPLDGAKGSEADPARTAFTERYLRRGIEAGGGAQELFRRECGGRVAMPCRAKSTR